MGKLLYIFSGICFSAFIVSFLVTTLVSWIFADADIRSSDISRTDDRCILKDAFITPKMTCDDPERAKDWNAFLEPFYIVEISPLLLLSLLEDNGKFTENVLSPRGIAISIGTTGAICFPFLLVFSLWRRRSKQNAATPTTTALSQ